MTEIAGTHYLQMEHLDPSYIGEDPRVTSTAFGERVEIGDPISPSDAFPNWQLSLFIFPDNPNKDGCIFRVGPNSATPVGIVGSPTGDSLNPPKFKERIIEGSGILLVQMPTGKVEIRPVFANFPMLYIYGKGAVVVYFAGEKGLVGVNVGEPAGIPEDPIERGDPRTTEEFWKEYDRLRPNPQST